MSGAPFFSIVVPTLNAEPYIDQTLESLATQTFRDFEVVIVDDGSRDGTRDRAGAALRRLALPGRIERRPDIVSRGVAAARNHGIQLSRGAWVAFLDGDDLFEPTKLERCWILAREFGPSAGAIHHSASYFDHVNGEVLGISPASPRTGNEFFGALLRQNSVVTSTVVLHRQCLEQTAGFDTRLNGVEDYWLWIRIAKRWPWRYLEEPLTRYRMREGSLMVGKPLVHYVGQYTALLAVAERSGELSPEELRILRCGILDGPVRFFAGKSLERGGIRELLAGMVQLARHGFPKSAASLMYRNVRARALRGVLQAVAAHDEGR